MVSEKAFIEKLDRFAKQTIDTPEYEAAWVALDNMRNFGSTPGGGRFMLLKGKSRSGKSHLLTAYTKRHPGLVTGYRTEAPVVRLELQGKATEAGTASQILRALNDLKPAQGRTDEKNERIIAHIRDLGVKLLIIDEAHHLVERKPGQQDRLYAATESFKYISNRTGCAIAFVGLPVIDSIAEVNQQLAQRTTQNLELRAFDGDNKEDRYIFTRIVKMMCGGAPVKMDAYLLEEPIIEFFRRATLGLIGNLSELIRAASIHAFMTQRETIDLSTLQEVYPKLGVAYFTEENPFERLKV